jgi:hypothetical protein
MASAADIQEAIDDVVNNIVVGNIQTDYGTWITGMFTEAGFNALAVGSAKFWDKGSKDERTVFDWAVPSLRTQRTINAQGTTVLTKDLAINIVLRTLLAVQAATVATRITQDQEDTVVAAYNAAF